MAGDTSIRICVQLASDSVGTGSGFVRYHPLQTGDQNYAKWASRANFTFSFSPPDPDEPQAIMGVYGAIALCAKLAYLPVALLIML